METETSQETLVLFRPDVEKMNLGRTMSLEQSTHFQESRNGGASRNSVGKLKEREMTTMTPRQGWIHELRIHGVLLQKGPRFH